LNDEKHPDKSNGQPNKFCGSDTLAQKQDAKSDKDERLGIINSGDHTNRSFAIGAEQHRPIDHYCNAANRCDCQLFPSQHVFQQSLCAADNQQSGGSKCTTPENDVNCRLARQNHKQPYRAKNGHGGRHLCRAA
jgi:hypothetical protein